MSVPFPCSHNFGNTDVLVFQIQHVEAEEWLGALIQANDNLVQALMTFEQLDRSIDADSDSEDEAAEQAHLYKSKYTTFPRTELSSHKG